MHIKFGYQPVNTGNLIKQYLRTNSKSASPSAPQRASILTSMLETPELIEPLTNTIEHNGKIRTPITGVTKIKETKYMGFPSAHVSYVASAPRKPPLSKQSATEDLADNLYSRLGIDGMFDLTPNGAVTSKIYQKNLGTDLTGQGNGRGLRLAIKNRLSSDK